MTLPPSLFDALEITSLKQLSPTLQETVINVASVPMRSPFRYPGGKTWLVPYVRAWLRAQGGKDKELIELFTGGGTVSLTAVFEGLIKCVTMVELDVDVAAVWEVITSHDALWLVEQILAFDLTPETAKAAIAQGDTSLRNRAFATIVKNRVNRGGILAEGASFVKYGENGKGIHSRWYPSTLKRRIMEIYQMRDGIKVV